MHDKTSLRVEFIVYKTEKKYANGQKYFRGKIKPLRKKKKIIKKACRRKGSNFTPVFQLHRVAL